MRGRERPQGLVQHHGRQHPFYVVHLGVHVAQPVGAADLQRPCRPGPVRVDDKVAGDPEHPGADGHSLGVGQVPVVPAPQQRLLEDVLRAVGVPVQHAQHVRVEGRPVFQIQVAQRLFLGRDRARRCDGRHVHGSTPASRRARSGRVRAGWGSWGRECSGDGPRLFDAWCTRRLTGRSARVRRSAPGVREGSDVRRLQRPHISVDLFGEFDVAGRQRAPTAQHAPHVQQFVTMGDGGPGVVELLPGGCRPRHVHRRPLVLGAAPDAGHGQCQYDGLAMIAARRYARYASMARASTACGCSAPTDPVRLSRSAVALAKASSSRPEIPNSLMRPTCSESPTGGRPTSARGSRGAARVTAVAGRARWRWRWRRLRGRWTKGRWTRRLPMRGLRTGSLRVRGLRVRGPGSLLARGVRMRGSGTGWLRARRSGTKGLRTKGPGTGSLRTKGPGTKGPGTGWLWTPRLWTPRLWVKGLWTGSSRTGSLRAKVCCLRTVPGAARVPGGLSVAGPVPALLRVRARGRDWSRPGAPVGRSGSRRDRRRPWRPRPCRTPRRTGATGRARPRARTDRGRGRAGRR